MALFRLTRIVEPEPVLRGDGVYLRPAAASDFAAWADLRARSRAFLTPREPIWPEDDLTRAAFRRRLRRQSEEMARDESNPFLIVDSASEVLLGGLTLGGVRRGVAQSATLGYWMGEPYAGKRVMTRAVAVIVKYGFTHLRLHRIEAACVPENVASRTLLEHNGFEREGLARSYLKINGVWRDHCLFACIDDGEPRLD